MMNESCQRCGASGDDVEIVDVWTDHTEKLCVACAQAAFENGEVANQ